MASVRGRGASVPVLLALVMVACGPDPAPTVLDPADFKVPEGMSAAEFDAHRIVDSMAFTDAETIDLPRLQRFFGRTPYGRRSFLETYQSNGVRATDAIIRAARQYRINPLVFLVFAQITQGLVGERDYPFPPDRVEYVFRCGCQHARYCTPSFAGFDRQVDCLGRTLRTTIDEIKANDASTSGWGPGVERITLDNIAITPDNDATAALYDRLPRVHQGKEGGTWIFWNVWHLYAASLDYYGPLGGTDGSWIGEPCRSDAMCSAIEGAICANNYPGGLCTVACQGFCPAAASKPESFCARFPEGGYCLPVCNPSAPTCREGYDCLRVAGTVSGESKYVCSPRAGG